MRKIALFVVMALAIATGCAPDSSSGGQGETIKFRGSKVTVVSHNDTFLYANDDEPYLLQLWFRVTYNKPNSAQVGIVGSRNNATPSLVDGQSHVLSGGQTAEVAFTNVKTLDVVDLLNTDNQLEIMGTWTWAMERDDVGVNSVAEASTVLIRDLLNTLVASGSIPEDPNEIVQAILGDVGNLIKLVAGALFSSIPGIPDDAIGSRLYVGIPAKGTLSNIIDATAANIAFPSIAIPIISVPPDINGGQIFSMGHDNKFSNEVFDSGNGRHDYQIDIVNAGVPNVRPTAAFTASQTTAASAPVTVSFDASSSTDPDGTIVAYNWNFGDYKTGSGKTVTNTFAGPGSYPVVLTVTDNKGESTAKTMTITVNGPPVVAPTGLTLTGSGATSASFSWNAVPGADRYEVSMDGFFGGGCVTDHSAVFTGQVTSGTINQAGLCLGSKYDVKIRAGANGQWGPWSSTQRFTL